MKSRDHPNYYIIEISQNTEKSPGEFSVTQTTEKNHYVTLEWKTPKEQIMIIIIA